MSLAIKYETAEDANLRLKNSLVMYKGEPVLITQVIAGNKPDDILRVLFKSLPLDKAAPRDDEGDERKFISSKHFDITPFKLGYVNSRAGLFYCTRMPHRIQKQGLCNDNFSGKTLIGAPVSFAIFANCKEAVETVKGIYPSFDRALKLLNDVPAVAFSRDFCIVKDEVIPHLVYLYHKNKKIGYWSKSEIVIGKQFNCLKESLTEMNLKVGVC